MYKKKLIKYFENLRKIRRFCQRIRTFYHLLRGLKTIIYRLNRYNDIVRNKIYKQNTFFIMLCMNNLQKGD